MPLVNERLDLLPAWKADECRMIINEKRRAASILGYLGIFSLLERAGQRRRFIARGKQGKPAFVNCDDLYFNISHSGDQVVCMLDSAPCGIDIEQLDRDFASVSDFLLSGSERSYLAKLPCDDYAIEYICTVWTLKEALGKCLGCGLDYDVRSVSFELRNPMQDNVEPCVFDTKPIPGVLDSDWVQAGGISEQLYFATRTIANSYRLSTCRRRQGPINWVFMTSSELLGQVKGKS